MYRKTQATKKHMVKQILSAALILSLLAVFSGCGKSAKDASSMDALKEKLKEAQNAQQVEEPVQEEPEPEETPEEIVEERPVAGGGLELYVQKGQDLYYGEEDYRTLLLDFSYDQLLLGEKDKEKYPELDKSLNQVNDLIAKEEAYAFEESLGWISDQSADDLKEGIEQDMYPDEMEWVTYVRRADEQVLSYLSQATHYSHVDYNYVETKGHTFDVASGKELELSDIVEDEDALYEYLAKKGKPIIEKEMADFYGLSQEQDVSELTDRLKEYLEKGQGSWVLDPQGLSFWFDSYSATYGCTCIPVLFCEDTDGKIFKETWSKNIPQEWSMEFPLYHKVFFDMEDDGKIDELYVGLDERWSEGDDYSYAYTVGFTVDSNDKHAQFPNDEEPYAFRFTLTHQDGKSILLEQHSEYDWNFMELVTLGGGEPKLTDCLSGGLLSDFDWESLPDNVYTTPRRILTDVKHVPVAIPSNMLSTCEASAEYAIKTDGTWEIENKRMEFFEDFQYEISLMIDYGGLHVVDEKTGEETGATLDIPAGEKLKMIYTDNETYVDCLTEDGLMVRIPFADDPDTFRSVLINGKPVDIWEVFEDMMFAG